MTLTSDKWDCLKERGNELISYTKYIKVWFAADGLVKVWHFKPSLLICLPYFVYSANLLQLYFRRKSRRNFKIRTFRREMIFFPNFFAL